MSYCYNGGVPQFFMHDVPDCSFCVRMHVCSGLIQDDDFLLLQQHASQVD